MRTTAWISLIAVLALAAIAWIVFGIRDPAPAAVPTLFAPATLPAPGAPPREEPRERSTVTKAVVVSPPTQDPNPVVEGARVSGRVLGGERGVARCTLRGWLEFQGRVLEVPAVESDAEGRYTLPLAAWETLDPIARAMLTVEVEARASGFQPLRLRTRLEAPAKPETAPLAELVFHLNAGRALTGRVVDLEHKPVAGADVALVVATKQGQRDLRVQASTAHSGSDGRFSLGFVSEGPIELVARAENVGAATLHLTLEAGQDRAVGDLELRGLGRLAGVAKFPDGQPVSDLDLWAVPELVATERNPLALCIEKAFDEEHGEGLFSTHTRTNEAGQFELRGLAPGRYMLRTPSPKLVMEPRIGYYALGTAGIELSVESYRLCVHVLDERQLALAGVAVALTDLSLAPDGGYEPGSLTNETSNAAGNVVFDVDPETTYSLAARAPTRARAEDLVILAQNEYVQRKELVLGPAPGKGRLRLFVQGDLPELPRPASVSVMSALTSVQRTDIGPLECDAAGWLPPLEAGKLLLQVGFARNGAEPSWYFPVTTKTQVVIVAGKETSLTLNAHGGGRLEVELALVGAPPPAFAETPPPGTKPELVLKWKAARLARYGASIFLAPRAGGTQRGLEFWQTPEGGGRERIESRFLPGTSARAEPLIEPGDYICEVRCTGFVTAKAEVRVVAGRWNQVTLELRAQ